jgi:hypothetical protein
MNAVRRMAVVAVLAAMGWAAAVRAAESDAEVQLQRALDQPLTLNLPPQPLSEAFKQIAATAKISLQVDPACYELLPYGETMRVKIDFNQSNMREALDVLLMPLGLHTTISGNVLLIRPSAALKHIGHRADLEELTLLKELWTSSDVKLPTTGALVLTDAIRGAMEGRKDLQVVMPAGDAVAAGVQDKAVEQIGKQLPMTAYRLLELYGQLTGCVWLVEAGPLAGGATGGKVIIMTQRQWIDRQLERPIQLSRTNEPLEVVVADLAHASGIRFVPEPGLYQAVPVVSLRSDNGTVRQTLEALQGATRIAFEVRDDAIRLYMAPGPGNPPRSDTIIGRISVPVGPNGTMMDVYIRESDLSNEQNDLRKKRIEEAVKEMQKSWTTPAAAGTGPAGGAGGSTAVATPATAPATGPATAPGTQPKGTP